MAKTSVAIRVWDGCTVVGVFTVSPTGHTSIGAVGGASNSTPIDIELDPQLIGDVILVFDLGLRQRGLLHH